MRTNLLLVLASTLFALILAEGITRLTYSELPVETWGRKVFCTGPDGLRIMRPGVTGRQFGGEFDVEVAANSKGYRDSEWSPEDGSFRILVLGDSFGWGWGVPADSMMVAPVERLSDVSVYNLSIPGDDLVAMYRRYRIHHEAIDPHLVVILNFINDFVEIDEQRNRLARLEEDGEAPSTGRCASISERSLRSLLDASYLYRLVNRFKLQRGIQLFPEAHRRELRRGWYAPEARLLSDPEVLEEALSFYRVLLRDIARRQPTLVVSVPSAYRFGGVQQEQLLEALEEWSEIDPGSWERGLETLCAETGVRCVSLVDALRGAGRAEELYFERDGHMRPRAQARAGRYLAAEIRSRIPEITPPASRGRR